MGRRMSPWSWSAALIAAISQFSAQAFSKAHGELRELDMGASHVLLRASARMVVAAEFSGAPDAAAARRMDSALFDLIDGSAPLDERALERLALASAAPPPATRSRASRWVLAGLLAAALFGALYGPVRDAIRDRRIEAAFSQAQAAQKLDSWPVTLAIDHGSKSVLVRGLAPAKTDLDALARALAPAAAPYAVAMGVVRLDEPAPPVESSEPKTRQGGSPDRRT